MALTHPITFEGLRHRWSGTSLGSTERAIEAERLVAYLQGLGFTIVTAADVLSAIEADPCEDELSAYRCVEGVAVSHASEGWWLLFPNGRVKVTMQGASEQMSLASGDRAC